MKKFYRHHNGILMEEYDTILPPFFIESNLDMIYTNQVSLDPPITPPPIFNENGKIIIMREQKPIVNIFEVLSLDELKTAIWETFNEYTYVYVDDKCKESGFKDYKDVLDSASNSFLPHAEQTEAQEIRNWWGRVWTEAYNIRDTHIFTVTDKANFLKTREYIEMLDAIV